MFYRDRLEQPAHKDIKDNKAFRVLKGCQDRKDIRVIPALKERGVLKVIEGKWECLGFRVSMAFMDYQDLQDQKVFLV